MFLLKQVKGELTKYRSSILFNQKNCLYIGLYITNKSKKIGTTYRAKTNTYRLGK